MRPNGGLIRGGTRIPILWGVACALWAALLWLPAPAAAAPPDLRGARVLWVHVGKAGGGATRDYLRENDVFRGSGPVINCKPKALKKRFRRPGAGVVEVHMCALNGPLLEAAHFHALAVSLREPVGRLVSAFKWTRYRRRRGWTKVRRATRQLFRCFPSVEQFGRALVNGSTASRECAAEARKFTDARTGPAGHHMTMNYQFYFGQVLQQPAFRALPVVALRLPSLQADLTRLMGALGAPVVRPGLPSSHQHYSGDDDRLEAATAEALREVPALRREEAIYRHFLEVAIDLEAAANGTRRAGERRGEAGGTGGLPPPPPPLDGTGSAPPPPAPPMTR